MKYCAQVAAWTAGIGMAVAAVPAAADFDGNLIFAQWYYPDWDSPAGSWEAIVDPDAPEYVYTIDGHPFGGYYFDLVNSTFEWKGSITDFISLSWVQGEVVGLILTDANGTIDPFESLEMIESQSSFDVDFSMLDYGVLNDDQFFINFGPISGGDYQFGNADGFTLDMTFVPAPAAGVLLLGLCAGRRRRRG